jgi:hypothetical protein
MMVQGRSQLYCKSELSHGKALGLDVPPAAACRRADEMIE